ncbi:GMC family oxidoreductase [Paraburkholderia sediminicola]|uniref:GMC family oxidoreductase n=1 Tax=Paraburkholderia sediminicola TaxID=458836 RepID=UPI0038B7248C
MIKEKDDSSDKPNRLAALDRALLMGRIDRRMFIRLCVSAGMSAASATVIAAESSAALSNQLERARSLESRYDYIVCGAGSSGCVVASRLAADPRVKVLLLEAGGSDEAPGLVDPGIWFTNIGSPTDWDYRSEPTDALNRRSVAVPMGRALGGGSSINAMVWARGHRNDFEFWAKEGGDRNWGYDHVLSIYKRIENWQGTPDPARRGTGGPVWVQQLKDPSPVATMAQKAAARIGIPAFEDMNGEMMEGEGGSAMPNVIIKEGRRNSMFSAYLRPMLKRPNLTVLSEAFVSKVFLQGDHADGVEFKWRGQLHRIQAGKVVLSMGAINTPKVLMLSGIGDQNALKKFEIRSRHHLPGVGENYQDHPIVEGCIWEYKTPLAPRNNAAEWTFFWKSRQELAEPDLQPFLLEIPVAGERMHKLYGMPENGFVIAPGLVRPKSRGTVQLRSSDPKASPLVQPSFLQHPDDIEALTRGVELCREIGNSVEMRDIVKREVSPGAVSKAEVATLLRNAAESYGHSTGTCRMGTDKMSVVDSNLGVHGLKNLYVADGSIMPRVTTGNTMAPCVIIGERMAEILTS